MGQGRTACHIRPEQIILEILEREMLHEHGHIIAEGVETEAEYDWLRGEGIDLYQGLLITNLQAYLFLISV